jgi:hypothetical protein
MKKRKAKKKYNWIIFLDQVESLKVPADVIEEIERSDDFSYFRAFRPTKKSAIRFAKFISKKYGIVISVAHVDTEKYNPAKNHCSYRCILIQPENEDVFLARI